MRIKINICLLHLILRCTASQVLQFDEAQNKNFLNNVAYGSIEDALDNSEIVNEIDYMQEGDEFSPSSRQLPERRSTVYHNALTFVDEEGDGRDLAEDLNTRVHSSVPSRGNDGQNIDRDLVQDVHQQGNYGATNRQGPSGETGVRRVRTSARDKGGKSHGYQVRGQFGTAFYGIQNQNQIPIYNGYAGNGYRVSNPKNNKQTVQGITMVGSAVPNPSYYTTVVRNPGVQPGGGTVYLPSNTYPVATGGVRVPQTYYVARPGVTTNYPGGYYIVGGNVRNKGRKAGKNTIVGTPVVGRVPNRIIPLPIVQFPLPNPLPAPISPPYSPKGTRCLSRATKIRFQLTPNSCAASMNYQGSRFVKDLDRPLTVSPFLVKIYGPGSVELLSGIYNLYDTLEINSFTGFDRVSVQIWTPNAVQVLQSFSMSTSCDFPLLLGDTFCGLSVLGFQNGSQGLVQMVTPAPLPNGGGGSNPTDPTKGPKCTSAPNQLKFKFTGDSCPASSNTQNNYFTCTIDNQPITYPAHVTIASANMQIEYFKGSVQSKDSIITIGDSVNTLASRMTVLVRSADQSKYQQVFTFSTDCIVDLNIKDTFGSLQLVQFKNPNQGEFFCCLPGPGSPPPPVPPPPVPPPPVPPPPAPPAPTPAPTNFVTPGPGFSNPASPPTSPPPTSFPTNLPTPLPVDPTKQPTNPPTKAPTNLPTKVPTKAPTNAPTNSPTKIPTLPPTPVPTNIPTPFPTVAPTFPTDANSATCRGEQCTSFSCQYKFQVLADGDCGNSFNDQTSAYFICAIDNPVQFPLKVTVFNQEFSIVFAQQTVQAAGEIVAVGNANLCSPSMSVLLQSTDEATAYKLFTINTSCETQPISIGDRFATFKVVEFINDKQGSVTGCKT